MTNQDVFVLGVGAQKAGTSWLHWYLEQAPNADCGRYKEYHVWDGLTLPAFPRLKLTPKQAQRNEKTALRYRMQQDPETYFSYFADRLASPDITVTADITPLYAALSAETLGRIRDGFAARGVACRAVFLMRDPMERLWSSARMVHRRDGVPINKRLSTPEAYLREIYNKPFGQVRSRYDQTIDRLERVFEQDAIYVGIYEEMFAADRIADLSKFLGIEARPELVQERINADCQAPAVPRDLAGQVAREYRDVYAFCAARWPELREIWPGFAYL